MNSSQIATLINDIYDGVERSKVGNITGIVEGKNVINHVPYQTFLALLHSLFPKTMLGEIKMKEDV